jgi:hypothetical protein
MGLSYCYDWSERRDLNSGPPVPQTGALTGLRYAPPGQVACSVGQVAPGREIRPAFCRSFGRRRPLNPTGGGRVQGWLGRGAGKPSDTAGSPDQSLAGSMTRMSSRKLHELPGYLHATRWRTCYTRRPTVAEGTHAWLHFLILLRRGRSKLP